MTNADREAKRAAKAVAKQRALEARILRDWDRAIREDRRRTIDRFCRRELGCSLEQCIEAVHRSSGAPVKGGYRR
jgi:hypothetical protein